MTKDEVLQQVKEALKYWMPDETLVEPEHQTVWNRHIELLAALEAALAKEAEPVAYINVEKQRLEWAKPTRFSVPSTVKIDRIPLYASPTPPATKVPRLTEDEILRPVVSASDTLDVTRVHELGGKTTTIIDGDDALLRICRAVETEVRRRFGVVE